jgi:hypothetical protein
MDMNCGFTTDLANGLTVSVQWHDCAYATRDDDGKLISVEMACWKTGEDQSGPHGGILWLTSDVWAEDCLPYEDVMGHVPVMDSMRMMDRAVQLPMDYVSLCAKQKETANRKQEAEDLKQEIEDLKQERDNLERERSENYDGII